MIKTSFRKNESIVVFLGLFFRTVGLLSRPRDLRVEAPARLSLSVSGGSHHGGTEWFHHAGCPLKKKTGPSIKIEFHFKRAKKTKQKTNSKSFTCFRSLRGKRLRREFKTNQRGVEACRDFQIGVPGGAAVTSVSPRYWGAAWEDRAHRAASRGRRPSRLRRSRCCWSPDRWGSTAQRARPGPGTPVGGGEGG